MLSSNLNTKAIVAVAVVALTAVQASPVSSKSALTSKRQLVGAIPGCSSELERKYQPAFDFDKDSCYNAPAVSPDAIPNPGRDTCEQTPELSQNCREPSYLSANNVYVRSRCNNGWCGLLYGYYYEVDAKSTCGGHRHDWEHVVVFTENDEIRYVATSAHGGYTTKAAGDYMEENGHPKVVYHKDGDGTHAHRFAQTNDDTPVENANGAWFYGQMVDYNGFPNDEIKKAMLDNDWGDGKIDFSDARFADALKSAKGGKDIPLDVAVDAPGTTDRPC